MHGTGSRGVVLVHGGRFTKESWRPQAEQLVRAGFRVLAIDMRGYGASKDGPKALNSGAGSPQDVLAAVRWLRDSGAKAVSVIGGSMGADAAAGASLEAKPGEIDALILLAGYADEPAQKLKGRKLFVVTQDDANAEGPRLPRIRKQYEAASDPKELLLLEGSAHAQFIFETPQGTRLMRGDPALPREVEQVDVEGRASCHRPVAASHALFHLPSTIYHRAIARSAKSATRESRYRRAPSWRQDRQTTWSEGDPFALECLLEAEQRPAIAWMFLQVLAIDLFGILEAAVLEERGAEPVVCREGQRLGFVVLQAHSAGRRRA